MQRCESHALHLVLQIPEVITRSTATTSMKTHHSIILGLFILAGFSYQSPSTNNVDSHVSDDNFDWIVGDWIRTNDQDDKMTFEMWNKVSDSEYRGIGYTMQKGDTIWQERMELIEKNGKWSFDVTGKGETEATKFRVLDIEVDGFTCENQENGFPKRIKYEREGEDLHAKISDDEMEVSFIFKKFYD